MLPLARAADVGGSAIAVAKGTEGTDATEVTQSDAKQEDGSFSIGHVGQGTSAPSQQQSDWRIQVTPELHFDGKKWRPVGAILKLRAQDPAPEIEGDKSKLPWRYKAMADVSRESLEQRGGVSTGQWHHWYGLFDNTRSVAATSGWQMHSMCEPTYVLGLDAKSNWQFKPRVSNLVSTSRAPVKPFVRTSLGADDRLRKIAMDEWRKHDPKLVQSAAESTILTSKDRIPSTVAKLRGVPLRWWRTLCASDGKERLCQLVARRRFDGAVGEKYSVEPVQYEIVFKENANGAAQVLRSRALWLPISDTWDGEPPFPDEPVALISAGGERWAYIAGQLLEGNSVCVHPLDRAEGKWTKDAVCVTWGC
jgi:hypothetical protein